MKKQTWADTGTTKEGKRKRSAEANDARKPFTSYGEKHVFRGICGLLDQIRRDLES
jgi:hypothetical protein